MYDVIKLVAWTLSCQFISPKMFPPKTFLASAAAIEQSSRVLFRMTREHARLDMKELRVKERWASDIQKRSNGEIEAD